MAFLATGVALAVALGQVAVGRQVSRLATVVALAELRGVVALVGALGADMADFATVVAFLPRVVTRARGGGGFGVVVRAVALEVVLGATDVAGALAACARGSGSSGSTSRGSRSSSNSTTTTTATRSVIRAVALQVVRRTADVAEFPNSTTATTTKLRAVTLEVILRATNVASSRAAAPTPAPDPLFRAITADVSGLATVVALTEGVSVANNFFGTVTSRVTAPTTIVARPETNAATVYR